EHGRAHAMVRSAAGADDPVPHQYVGAVLLLRHARAAGLLHDQAAAAEPGHLLDHLRRLYRLRLLHSDC
ncbi:MAG: Di-tripeptide/cation symporter, partial [uncultured Sphingomonadaceae bacterium]